MLAAMEGNTGIGKVLLASGTKIEATNDFGETALSLAAHSGHVKFARWLLSVGASTGCRPHGHDLATWIEISSGLAEEKLAEVLSLIVHKEQQH